MDEKLKQGVVAYRGVMEPRPGGSNSFDCQVYVDEPDASGGRLMSRLSLRLDIMDRSPAGLSWGYYGAGPHQLAVALLAHAFGVPPSPRRRDNVPMGEDEELDAERSREAEARWATWDAGLDPDYRGPIYLGDETELMPEETQTLDCSGVRKALELHGELVDDVVARLRQETKWVIWQDELLAWVRAKEAARKAIARQILLGAQDPALPGAEERSALPSADHLRSLLADLR